MPPTTKTAEDMDTKEILMRRDGLSEQEAIDLIRETREMILGANIFEADEIMADMLGLEPDYIFDVLGY